jgi:biopolymer transport protein ExbB
MRLGIVLALLLLTPSAWAQSGSTGGAAAASSAPPPSVDLSLRDAYKREFAFLAGQKRQLEKRLEQVGEQADQAEANLQAEIRQLEARLLATEARAQDQRDALGRAEQGQQSSIDDDQLVDATLEQARATLADYGAEVPEAGEGSDRAELLAGRVEAAVSVLGRLSDVTKTKGEFFAKNGAKTDGEIVRVGRIAAYGVGGSVAGALAPAGGGRLKIWKDDAAETARALAGGGSTDTLKIFLYESLEGQVDESEGETLYEHVDSSGIIGWVIVALGALGLILVLLRAFLLSQSSTDSAKLEKSVGGLVEAGKYREALDAAKRAKGSAARVVAALLPSLERGSDDLEDVVSESLLGENRRTQRFGAVILVIAAVAPLLGLLGTVTGMISTFDIITKYGTGDPKMLSGGISTALVTTELGLVVAIPTLLLGNLLRGWADGIESDAERVALRVVNIHKDAREAEKAAPTTPGVGPA